MTKRWLLVVGCACGLFWFGTADVNGAKPPSAVPLRMALRDLGSDGLRSDGGVYTSGAENVRAVLLAGSSGNFVFDTNDSSGMDGGRRLLIDFQGQSSPFQSPFEADVFLGSLVVDLNAPDNLLEMVAGGPDLQRRARLSWAQGSFQYSLRWDNVENHGDGLLNFHCELGSPCTSWTVTPSGPAGLYSVPTKGKSTETYYGSYSMPFAMTLEKLP